MRITTEATIRHSATSATVEEEIYSTGQQVGGRGERKPCPEEKNSVTVRQDEEKPVNTDALHQQYGEHPDGGFRAWLVVTGCAAGACATFGFVNAWGVFQAYYEENLLAGTAPSTIAWIGSIQYALIFLPGLIVGRIFDMGWTKIPLAVASAVITAATFLTGECTEYWQFVLCQGIALGLASGFVFGLVMGCPAHWFKRRVGLALSVMAIGSSVGGTCFPIAVRSLVGKVGFKWTMRILGLTEVALLALVILTVQRRLPPRKRPGPFVDLTAFKSPAYSLYCAASFVAFLGMYTVLTYIDVSAAASGIDPNLSFYLLAIANGCSMFGRLSGGIMSDRYGPLNVMTPVTAVAGILTYVWPSAKSVGAYVAIAILYGAASGVYVSLLPAPVVRMGKTHDVGTRVGMSMTIIAVGAVAGPPISGAINDSTGGFRYTGIYAGTAVFVACCFLLATRFALLGRWLGHC